MQGLTGNTAPSGWKLHSTGLLQPRMLYQILNYFETSAMRGNQIAGQTRSYHTSSLSNSAHMPRNRSSPMLCIQILKVVSMKFYYIATMKSYLSRKHLLSHTHEVFRTINAPVPSSLLDGSSAIRNLLALAPHKYTQRHDSRMA